MTGTRTCPVKLVLAVMLLSGLLPAVASRVVEVPSALWIAACVTGATAGGFFRRHAERKRCPECRSPARPEGPTRHDQRTGLALHQREQRLDLAWTALFTLALTAFLLPVSTLVVACLVTAAIAVDACRLWTAYRHYGSRCPLCVPEFVVDPDEELLWRPADYADVARALSARLQLHDPPIDGEIIEYADRVRWRLFTAADGTVHAAEDTVGHGFVIAANGTMRYTGTPNMASSHPVDPAALQRTDDHALAAVWLDRRTTQPRGDVIEFCTAVRIWRIGEPAVHDLSKPIEQPALHWQRHTDPTLLTEFEALQWITAEHHEFFLRIAQWADEAERGDITLRIIHDTYDDPGWVDSVVYDSVDDAKDSGAATIADTLNGELTRVAVRALGADGLHRWTVVSCPITALGDPEAEAREIVRQLPNPPAAGSAGGGGPVIVVEGCQGFAAGCSTWSHCHPDDLDNARHQHWDCQHALVRAFHARNSVIGNASSPAHDFDLRTATSTERGPV